MIAALLLAVGCAPQEAAVERPGEQRTVVPQGRDAVTFTPLPDAPDDPLRLSDELVPYPAFELAPRPRPLLELGDPFLGNGPLRRGSELPTGQVLQPWFLVFGTFRTALQTFDAGDGTTTEWANRLDLHGNLNLSGTERLVVSFRPIDDDRGGFTGQVFESETEEGWRESLRPEPVALFFEGELGEILPGLDPEDRKTLDWGFSVGRQPLLVQEGVLVDDDLDLVGVTRNSLTARGVSNLRLTGVFAWSEVNRADRREQESAYLVGLLSSADAGPSTVALDALYVHDEHGDTDAWYVGASTTQRLGATNTTFRAAGSLPIHGSTPEAGGGAWISAELSRTLEGSDDFVYWNSFWNVDDFTPAAVQDDRGGAASSLGMLYDPVGMGSYGVPFGEPLNDTVGTTLGYQAFLDGTREHLVAEVALRESIEVADEGQLGLGLRYQRALGQHHVVRLDAFAVGREGDEPEYGVRLEWRVEF